jgi:hypothetical protein
VTLESVFQNLPANLSRCWLRLPDVVA